MEKIVEYYTSLTVAVTESSAGVDASINHEARDPRRQDGSVHIYRFASSLELQGVCTYPNDRIEERYRITVYGQQPQAGDLAATLSDYQAQDQHGEPKFRQVRGREMPVYDIPYGLGLLHKEQGTTNWNGCIWVPEQTLGQMLSLVTTVKPLFMEIHERRIDRNRWINSLTLQTNDPAAE